MFLNSEQIPVGLNEKVLFEWYKKLWTFFFFNNNNYNYLPQVSTAIGLPVGTGPLK